MREPRPGSAELRKRNFVANREACFEEFRNRADGQCAILGWRGFQVRRTGDELDSSADSGTAHLADNCSANKVLTMIRVGSSI
jgi:hypothetical protein